MPHPRCPAATLERLFAASGAARWGVSVEVFSAALDAAVEKRFGQQSATAGDVEAFVASLHVEDLALACGCRSGHDAAWDHFIRDVRPQLYAAARAFGADPAARDLVDSLFAELYGLRERGGERVSLFTYYHGRARLIVWLRAILAQRRVDGFRERRRTTSLEDEPGALDGVAAAAPSAEAAEFARLAQAALNAAVADVDPRDRLRLRLYYGERLTLAQVGRLLGEHEATVSRNIDRARRQLRRDVETRLSRDHGLDANAVRECLRTAADSAELDVSSLLVKDER
jgi:RNA polymerase sigma-70 factor (ECF subfamily)